MHSMNLPQIEVKEIQGVIWVKVFKNGPSKICGRQPLKILIGHYQSLLK